MLKNYFTIFIRNIRKRKFFASINILGMTAGITACLLIALYVIDEFSYDRFHSNADRIYQVGLYKKFGKLEGSKFKVQMVQYAQCLNFLNKLKQFEHLFWV